MGIAVTCLDTYLKKKKKAKYQTTPLHCNHQITAVPVYIHVNYFCWRDMFCL